MTQLWNKNSFPHATSHRSHTTTRVPTPDPYFTHFEPKDEHHAFKEALQRLEEMHREKVTKVGKGNDKLFIKICLLTELKFLRKKKYIYIYIPILKKVTHLHRVPPDPDKQLIPRV